MFEFVENVRSFVQGIIRGGQEVGYTPEEIHLGLEGVGLVMPLAELEEDFAKYAAQRYSVLEAEEYNPASLLPRDYYVESTKNLAQEYFHEVQWEIEDAEGKRHTLFASVVGDERMTMDEVLEEGRIMSEKYLSVGEFVVSDVKLSGLWRKAG